MRTFWLRGYDGTSLSDLERATSLVRTSLYNSFGNKPEMFLDSLSLYHEAIESRIDRATADGGVEALCEVIAAMIEGRDTDAGQPAGCLMVGAAMQSTGLEARHVQRVRDYRQMLVRKAVRALEQDRRSGRLKEAINIESASQFLVCVVWGALAAQCLHEDENPAAASVATLRGTMANWIDC